MLEANNQGHKRKCSPKKKKKKKGLHKKFSADLRKKKVFTTIFQEILKKKEKKRSSQKLFRRSPQKNVFQKIFQALHKILTIQKILLFSSRSRPIFEDLRPRGQGQGLQNVSSTTPPLLIRRIIGSHLCKTVGSQQVCKQSKKL